MSDHPRVRVEPLVPSFAAAAHDWALRLGLPEHDEAAGFALQLGETGLQLQVLKSQGPARCGWISSRARRRIAGSSAAAVGR
ncbi:Ribosomal RNA small subunit methyltransferase J OS=Stutzerimonas stutzeri OX=316 GN=rsmJ PE=3 SV=1 [Stutzerimonas stutzeri]